MTPYGVSFGTLLCIFERVLFLGRFRLRFLPAISSTEYCGHGVEENRNSRSCRKEDHHVHTDTAGVRVVAGFDFQDFSLHVYILLFLYSPMRYSYLTPKTLTIAGPLGW